MCCAPRLPLLPDRCLPAWAISTAYVFGVGSDLELAALVSSLDMPHRVLLTGQLPGFLLGHTCAQPFLSLRGWVWPRGRSDVLKGG